MRNFRAAYSECDPSEFEFRDRNSDGTLSSDDDGPYDPMGARSAFYFYYEHHTEGTDDRTGRAP